MKKFSRCILILILVMVISGAGGYFYENSQIPAVYTSTTQLYVVPGEENEASVRASNGGLNNDFTIIFKSNVVISEAQKAVGTTEDIAQYLTVSSPANSNIVEIVCTNPDQNTAKSYVDAVAKTAIKTTSIIPVKSIQILSEGTSNNEAVKPGLYRNTILIVAAATAMCFIIELIIVLIISAFKKTVDNSDDETEYERYYGKYADRPKLLEASDDKAKAPKTKSSKKKKNEPEDMRDILEDYDEDYSENETANKNNEESETKIKVPEYVYREKKEDNIVKAESKFDLSDEDIDDEINNEPDYDESIDEIEKSVAEEAVSVAEPVMDTPVVEQPTVETPSISEPVIETPVYEEPVVEEPVVEEPVYEEPVVEESVVETPVAEEQMDNQPVSVDSPIKEESIEDIIPKVTYSVPNVEDPSEETSVEEETIVEESNIEEPVVEEQDSYENTMASSTQILGIIRK